MQNYKNKHNVLLDNTAVDSTGVADAAADPLSTPSSDIDISRPIAMAANYEMSVKEAKIEPKKDDASRSNIVLKMVNVKEARSTKGQVIEPGHLVLTKYLPTQATDKMSITAVGQGIAKHIRGLGLPASLSPRDAINNPSVFAGKTGLFKVKIKKETAEYTEGNELGDPIIEG